MVRPPALPPEEKVRIVLSILAGEMTVAEAARRAKVSEQSIGTWKRQFLESCRAGLAGKSGPSTREQCPGAAPDRWPGRASTSRRSRMATAARWR
ncbi:helix-turn-helix domain-containing protein [Kitasatospora cinereorecta]|uniref:Transposase n=1 Tax=Kitasatospora cinereorecta TaxID=285560 RepID=A0ABW0VNG8_9ACTN